MHAPKAASDGAGLPRPGRSCRDGPAKAHKEETYMERNAMPARRRLALAALIVAAAAATPAALYAQTGQWPTRPVKLVVFPPGGSTDAIGRLLAVELARIWARPSSSRTRAAPTAISARTRWPRPSRTATLLLSGVGSNAINYALYASMPYRDSDFAHVSLLATGPNVLVAAPDFPARPSRTSSGWRASRTSTPTPARAAARPATWPWKCSSSRPGSIWCTCRTRAARRPSRTCWAVA